MSGDQKTLSEAELYELYRHSLREQHVKEETIVKMSRSLMRALTQPSSDSTGDPTPRSHRVSLQQYLTAIHSDEQLVRQHTPRPLIIRCKHIITTCPIGNVF